MAPLSRFNKLEETKQARILDAAAEEFVQHGFEGASLNRIIAAAGVSKGAMYYYFEDKADLFVTVVRRMDESTLFEMSGVIQAETAEAFWDAIDRLAQHAIAHAHAHPEWMALGRAFYQMAQEQREGGAVGAYVAEKVAELSGLVQRGRDVGAIRTDLPLPLVVQLWMAMNETVEKWVLSRWDAAEVGEQDWMMRVSLDAHKRVLVPHELLETLINPQVEDD